MEKKSNKLENNRFFKEFMFVKADEEYKSDFVQNTSPEFENAIREYLKKNPGTSERLGIKTNINNNQPINTSTDIEISKIGLIEKKEYNYTQQESGIALYKEIQESSNNNTSNNKNTTISEKKEPSNKDKKIKTLYRKIATKTHPDKVKFKFLNDLYLKAKTYYQNNDLFSLYLICNDIDVEYNLDDDEIFGFKNQINQLKISNQFVEKTYLWMWYFEDDDERKSQIIAHFIENNPQQVKPIA